MVSTTDPFNLREELFGRALRRLPRKFRNCLCHDDDPDVVSAQIPITLLATSLSEPARAQGPRRDPSLSWHPP